MPLQRRIAFVGASGTGKTAMVRHVMDLVKIPFIESGARKVAREMGFETPYGVDAAGRRGEFQLRLLQEKIKEEMCHDDFVTDRSVADVLAYHTLHDAASLPWLAIELAREAFKRYTHVFLCPIYAFQQLGDDPNRLKNPAYHWAFETLCFSLVKKFLPPTGCIVSTLYHSDLESRFYHVRQTTRL